MELDRRKFLNYSLGGTAIWSMGAGLPAWARSARYGNRGISTQTGSEFDLHIHQFPVEIAGKKTTAVGVNGNLPAPLLRFREGDEVTLRVTNHLHHDSSIHWHGILLPFYMDGVPGVSFPGIRPRETFTYQFRLKQNGTYWYHSHSGLQEQLGHYGPIIIDPSDVDPIAYDREYVLVLSDWSFTNPHRIFAKLKKNAESLNFSQPSLTEPVGLGGMWANMRMNPRDIADISGETYHFLLNGHSSSDHYNILFKPGEKVRLRIISASAMTLFNFRIPGQTMRMVQADGLNIVPVDTDEFQIGVAETYDVIVQPKEHGAFAMVAEAIDRSGQVVAGLVSDPSIRVEEPELRPMPILSMRDMGMDHDGTEHAHAHRHSQNKNIFAEEMKRENTIDRRNEDHESSHGMHQDHKGQMASAMSHHSAKPDPYGPRHQWLSEEAKVQRTPGVANIAAMPTSRLDEAGIGLENVPHRCMTYSQLRSLEENPDLREPEREMILHLTGNMERYIWSFDGIKFSEITEAIRFHEGERVRLTLINDTMMSHPIHLHGMFFDLVNGGGPHKPRKHTVIVKPAEKLSLDITADQVGDWAFHCHLLYHMHAGMMQVVSILPKSKSHTHSEKPPSETGHPMDHKKDLPAHLHDHHESGHGS